MLEPKSTRQDDDSPIATRHPLAVGGGWMALLGGVGIGFLMAQHLWRQWWLGIDDSVLASRDQLWALAMLLVFGLVVGVSLALVQRRHRQPTC